MRIGRMVESDERWNRATTGDGGATKRPPFD